jgi:hypothetical protein
VINRQFIFQTAGHGSAEAERFVLLMRRLEAFGPCTVFHPICLQVFGAAL